MNTPDVEVTNIDAHGVWLWVKGGEYLLPHDQYPWFKEAKLADVLDVQLLDEDHLYWPALDVDLSVEALGRPEAYPLVYR